MELAEGAPNVVVILIDTLRPDHLPPYGHSRRVAPFLAGLSRESVIFQNAFSTSSWTAPSTASLFTGMYPARHGVVRGFFAAREDEEGLDEGGAAIELTPLAESVLTLPRILRDLGYTTFGLAANINVGPELGFARGFDRFHRDRQENAEHLAIRLHRWQNELKGADPYFLYLHFNDVHKPYTARPPVYEAHADPLEDSKSRYDSEIRWVDRTIRDLYEQFGWADDTILWILSDHGEEFEEHGQIGHGFTLYDELLRVVGILRAPGIEPGTVAVNVSLIDVLPTLVDWLDVPLPDAPDGRSLLPLLRGEGRAEAERAFAERILFGHRRKRQNDAALWAALFGSWKLIEDPAGKRRLFDLDVDPGETTDRAAEHPAMVEALVAGLERMKKQASTGAGAVQVPMDEALLEHLRSLGYTETEDDVRR